MEAEREKGGLYRVGWREVADKYFLENGTLKAY